jgi:hypothetical protein
LSIALLVMAGEMHAVDFRRAGLLLPAMLLGFAASFPLSSVLDRGYLRPALLAFSGSTAALLLVLELT